MSNADNELPEGAEVLMDGNRGIHLPGDFVRAYRGNIVNENVISEDLDMVETDTDTEGFAWQEIIDNAVLEIDGKLYELYQDGDLFIVPKTN